MHSMYVCMYCLCAIVEKYHLRTQDEIRIIYNIEKTYDILQTEPWLG